MLRLRAALFATAAVLSAAPAAADHCSKEYSQFRAEREELERVADRAEARGDIAAQCKALDQLVASAKRELQVIKPGCYHIAALADAGRAHLELLEELRGMTCDPDFDWGDMEDW